MRAKQRGIALISILLVFVFATIMVTSMLRQQRLDFSRTSFLVEYQRAKHYAMGAEQIARILLRDDIDNDKQAALFADTRAEAWAFVQEEPFADEQQPATMSYRIQDLQGCFNLKNLVSRGPLQIENRKRFKVLLEKLQVPLELADEAVDWIDENKELQPFGAEEGEYLSQDPPYRSADSAMLDVSELRLLKNMQPEYFNVLIDHVCTLEFETTINVNTASVVVLQSIAPGLDETAAQELFESLAENPVTKITEFASRLGSSSGYSAKGLGVNSSFFKIQSKGQYSDTQADLVSTVFRDAKDGTISVLQRNWGQSLPRLTSLVEK